MLTDPFDSLDEQSTLERMRTIEQVVIETHAFDGRFDHMFIQCWIKALNDRDILFFDNQ